MMEPAVALSDYGLALECAIAAVLCARWRGVSRPWSTLFYVALATAAAAGGTAHGFWPSDGEPVHEALWTATLLPLGAVTLAMVGMCSARRDDETVLAWARRDWACVVINLCVAHDQAGLARAAEDFRRLIDLALGYGGSYYLTYHRWATREQAEAAHPRLREFLRRKRELDPRGVFQSDWYRHHAALLGLPV